MRAQAAEEKKLEDSKKKKQETGFQIKTDLDEVPIANTHEDNVKSSA